MSITRNLEVFFSQNSQLSDYNFLITRSDGFPVYANMDESGSVQKLGALVTALSHSSRELCNTLNLHDSMIIQMTSTHSGFFLDEINIQGTKLFILLSFKDEKIIGKLRFTLKNIIKKIELTIKLGSQLTKKEEYLFSSISDEEIDRLFSFAGT